MQLFAADRPLTKYAVTKYNQTWSSDGGYGFRVLGEVSAVPEPATWAMMIAGFGLIGGAVRRRRVTIRFATA